MSSDQSRGRPPFHLVSSESYTSRRSPVLTTGGAVASSQPLATRAGLRILDAGGTAADAAIAVAAALQVTQACSTGLGGDAFCLYYDAASSRLYGLNGSGRAPGALTLEEARKVAVDGHLPDFHAHTVTVPGAAAAWEDTQRAFGRLSFGQCLEPAIRLAADGFPVAPNTAAWWSRGAERQLAHTEHGHELMVDGAPGAPTGPAKSRDRGAADSPRSRGHGAADSPRSRGHGPHPGDVMRLPTLAASLEALATDGAAVFYRGWIAERIVQGVGAAGGLLSLEDLSQHQSEWVTPIGVPYGSYTIWECPPNGQGIAALMALGIHDAARSGLSAPPAAGPRPHAPATVNPDAAARLSAADYHLLIESMRLAFADARRYVADPAAVPVPAAGLIDPAYLASRAAFLDPARRRSVAEPGVPAGAAGDDTVYFCVVDADGNACSFINSNFMGFGTGIVPEGCGFSLQNRGRGFVLDPDHPNCLAPHKRPFHTIIPGRITRRTPAPATGPTNPDARAGLPVGPFAAAFGVMGGMMQPQGHLQVADALIRRGIDPQAALDAPRFQLANGDPNGRILLEPTDPEEPTAAPTANGETGLPGGGPTAKGKTAPAGGGPPPRSVGIAEGLRALGHEVEMVTGSRRAVFGLGQVIWRDERGVLWCGSDPRGDGCAQPQ